MQKVWETTSLALMLIAAVAFCVRFEPRPLSPEQITSNFESRKLYNPKLKEFLETNLNRKFFNWPASSRDFSMLTLVALYYHPELDVARAKHISPNTK
jgi:outer membrane protein, heavy metal efflux system